MPGAGNPAAWNRYGYVMYNPVKYTDPSGHIPIIDFGLNPEDYHSTESFENEEHTENISDCLEYGESLYIEVEITADNWDNYLRSLERKGSDVDKQAFLLHLIVGLFGAGIGGGLGTLASSPVGGAVAAVGTFAIAEGLAYILPSGARDAFQMNDVILALDEQFAELGDHETVVLTVFHNSGPPENHPASNGYSLRVDGEIA